MLKLIALISLGIILSGCTKSYEDVDRLKKYCENHNLEPILLTRDHYVLDVVCVAPDGSRYPSKFSN